MKRSWRIMGVCAALMVSLAAVTAAQAKGGPSKAVITGPGIRGQIDVTDAGQLQHLGFGLMQIPDDVPAPYASGPGFDIINYNYDTQSQSYIPTSVVVYYPHAYGGHGYVYYVATIPFATSYDRKWFLAQPESDRALRQLLKDHGALDGNAAGRELLSLPWGIWLSITLAAAIVVAVATRWKLRPRPRMPG